MITTEKHELVVVRRVTQETTQAFCSACATKVEVFNFDAAIGYSGLTGRELVRRIECGAVHSIEATADSFGVCGRSLQMERDDERNDRE